MSTSTVLYRKYRARTFDEIRGQETVVSILRNSISQGKIAHAYLFSGPRGTGKTSMARLLAKAVNSPDFNKTKDINPDSEISKMIDEGSFIDLIEIDAASNRGIEEIRQIKEGVNFRPSHGAYKVYIIDEVHMLTREAFNALLKTLEEPPAHAIFILATTEPHKVPETILSRLQRFDFRLATNQELISKLEYILQRESLEADLEALQMICSYAGGSYRDAESTLGKLLSESADQQRITVDKVLAVLGIAPTGMIVALIETLRAYQASTALSLLGDLVAMGAEIRQVTKQLAAYLRDSVTRAAYDGLDYAQDLKLLRKMLQVINEFRFVDDSQMLLELMVLEWCGTDSQQPQPKPTAKKKESANTVSEADATRWNVVQDKVRKQSVKLWTFLRATAVEEHGDSKLVIKSVYASTITALQHPDNISILRSSLESVYNPDVELEFVIEDNSGVQLSNEKVIESTF